jgi:dipeptidyl aminopeptidase/acylaminoacyl peptidase
VHGGPHTAYGNGFVFEFQVLASHGYAVLYGNPRGSTGLGHDFAANVLGDYGGEDAQDVLDIADAGLAALGTPKAPLHLTGGSYGGFMTNWLVGVTDRFRSAVSQRSISNWTSMYGTSDIGPSFVERELGANPWGDFDALWRQSPLRNAANVRTPLLLIHSEHDWRCPIEQAEQFFSALKRIGQAEVELLRFPDEGHELSRSGRPDRRLLRLNAIVDWFEAHP